jgi:tRNA(fMet)-specific endonuclease VapC
LESYVIGDTDVIIDFFSGKETYAALVHDLIQDNRLAISSITAFELYAGITGKRRIQQIDRLVSFVPVLSFALTEAAIAAQIYSNLRQSGTLIGNQEICIAATCLARDLPLLTRNLQHFSRINNLNLYTGPKP